MSKIFKSIVFVLTIGALAAYFTCIVPETSNAASDKPDGIDSMIFILFQRVQNIEKTKGIKVPDNLKMKVNGQLEK